MAEISKTQLRSNITTDITTSSGNKSISRFDVGNILTDMVDSLQAEGDEDASYPDFGGEAGNVLAVNASETDVEWVAPASGGASTLLGLTDTPSTFGTEGQVLAVNADTDAVEWVAQTDGTTDLSLPALGQTAISREIASSTGTNVIIPAADAVMHAGLMTAADKGQLTTTILDPSAWFRNLEGVGHSAEDVANTFDTYIPDRLQEFQLHASYLSNEVAYYHRVLYLALNDITDASTVPAVDPDNWREFSTHRIEGYGDLAMSLKASTLLETVEIAAKTAGFSPVYYPLVLTTANNFPQTILAINTDGELEALNDVTNVSFPNGDDLVAIVAASIPDGETRRKRLRHSHPARAGERHRLLDDY